MIKNVFKGENGDRQKVRNLNVQLREKKELGMKRAEGSDRSTSSCVNCGGGQSWNDREET